MDRLFAAPPPDRQSNKGIVASAGVHLAAVIVVIGVGARVTSTPASPRQSITFINAATAIGFTDPPDAGVAPRIHRVEPIEAPRASVAPQPLQPRPVPTLPRFDAAPPEAPAAAVADPTPPAQDSRVAVTAEELPAPVVGMFDRAVGGREGAATAAVRVAGFSATQRPGLRPAVDAAAQPAGFDRVVAPRVSMTMAAPVAAAIDTPIEVLFKPSADYTDEARTLRIEGEVVVEAAFGPSGEVSVVRLVQRLGHGLDETAARAVSGIRFRPATRDGVPVAVRTFVHIEFRLT